MSSKTTTSGGGIGLFGVLGVLFIGLKLGGVIAWSWWWVLCPLWAPTAIFLAILLVIGLIGLIAD